VGYIVRLWMCSLNILLDVYLRIIVSTAPKRIKKWIYCRLTTINKIISGLAGGKFLRRLDMNRLWFGFLLTLLALLTAGCGSGGTTANGSTVFITASGPTTASSLVFAHMSSNGVTYIPQTVAMSVTSTPYSTTGNVPSSDVTIDKINFTYTPTNSTGVLAPTLKSPQITYIQPGYRVTPNSTIPISFTLPGGIDFSNIVTDTTNGTPYTGEMYAYQLNITMECTEVNTGTSLVPNTVPITLGVVVPPPGVILPSGVIMP